MISGISSPGLRAFFFLGAFSLFSRILHFSIVTVHERPQRQAHQVCPTGGGGGAGQRDTVHWAGDSAVVLRPGRQRWRRTQRTLSPPRRGRRRRRGKRHRTRRRPRPPPLRLRGAPHAFRVVADVMGVKARWGGGWEPGRREACADCVKAWAASEEGQPAHCAGQWEGGGPRGEGRSRRRGGGGGRGRR